MAWPAKGRASSSTRKMATILGTNTRVCSWIWVTACSRPIPRPTTRAVTMEGAMISSSTRMALRAKSMVEAGSISISVNRHVHDGLVGGHDLVADGHHRIQGDFGGVHRLDHIHQISLALHLLGGGAFALADGADRILDRTRQEV